MSATSLKLPEELKRRIEALVEGTDLTPHAFMVAAIARETELAELRERFGETTRGAEEDADDTREAYDADEIFSYLKARAARKNAKRPRPNAWRRSN